MKITRSFALLLMTCGSILLGACASFQGNGANGPVATLPTVAPIASAVNTYGVDSPLSSTKIVVPVKIRCAGRIEALAAGQSYAAANGGSVTITSGTPSMEPLIHGQTYVVVQKRPYDSIAKRDLLVYMGRPDASKPDRSKMLHRAVQHDRYGWLMSGDNNRWSESWDRVTPQTYLGIVVALFEFPQT